MKTMGRSPSNVDEMNSLKESGGDLTEYKQQLTRERNARSLSLRRMNRPTLSGVFGNNSRLRDPKRARVSLSDAKQLLIEHAVKVFDGGVESQIAAYCDEIANSDASMLRSISSIAKSTDVAISISATLQSELSSSTLLSILGLLAILFPLANDTVNVYIDEGLCFLLLNLLESEEESLVTAAISFIGILSEASGYARDSLLCLELHFQLVQIAINNDGTDISTAACDAILKIFANQQEIDLQVLKDAVGPMAPLLELTSPEALHSVIMTFTEMACKMQTLVITYHEIGLFSKAVQFLQNTELTDATLKLVGILSIGQPSHVRGMLEDGLLDVLLALLSGDFTADVFWVLSNLIESLQQSVINELDEGFLDTAIQLADAPSFEVKKEAAFFISTFALFADSEQLMLCVRQDAFDLLVDMMGCGVSIVIIRIIDCIVRMLHVAQPQSLLEIVQASDLRARLGEVIDTAVEIVADRASYLVQNLDALEVDE